MNSLGKFPRLSAQTLNDNATPDREYPIQEAGSLINIPGVYNGSSQIYGTYDSNRWFVRGGANVSNDPTAHTSWKELATTAHLSNYLPLSGGTMTGNIMFPTSEVHIVQTLKSTSNYGAPIRWMVGNETRAMIGYHTTGGDGTAGAIILTPTNPGSSPWENGNGLFLDRNKIYFNGQELAKVSQIPSIPSAETAATIMSKINSQSEITFSKHVVCSAGAGLQSTSDIRFKSNLKSLPDDTLNKVLNAPEFTYNWKDETTTSIGTSAQYWEDKIPTLVHEMEDGTKTFSYERYTVVLQKALKEEHRLREEEKKRFKEVIDSLNTRLNDLTLLIQKLI